MDSLQGARSSGWSVVACLQEQVVEVSIARGARDEVQLARTRRDDSIALEAPVSCCRVSAKTQRLVRRAAASVDVEVELGTVRLVERNCAANGKVPAGRLRAKLRDATYIEDFSVWLYLRHINH